MEALHFFPGRLYETSRMHTKGAYLIMKKRVLDLVGGVLAVVVMLMSVITVAYFDNGSMGNTGMITAEARVNGSANFNKDYVLTGDGATDMVNIARAQVGLNGGKLGYSSEEWCADFVSDCAILAGQSKAIPANASCIAMQTAIKKAGGSVVSAKDARAGDILFYSSNSFPNGGAHVEIVYAQKGSTLYTLSTIGGNSGNSNNSLSMVKDHSSQGSSPVPYTVLRPNYSQKPWEDETSKWNVPITVTASKQITVYNFGGSVDSGHYISKGDKCYIDKVYLDTGSNVRYVHVKYPTSSGDRWAYAKLTDLPISPDPPSNVKLTINKTTFYFGDTITFTPTANNATGYYLAIRNVNGTIVHDKDNITGKYSIKADTLSCGEYTVWVSAKNSAGGTDSNHITFSVKDYAVTIHYNTNGGTIAEDSEYYAESNGDIYKADTKKMAGSSWANGYKGKNGLYNASTFKLSRTGYTFLGWSLQKTGGKVFDQHDNTISANDLFPDVTKKNGTIILYAQWEINTVTIHYNTNSGTIAKDSEYYAESNGDIYKADTKELVAPSWANGYKGKNGLYNASTFKLSKTGYTFLGWSLEKTGGKVFDQYDNTVSANDLFPDVTKKNGTITLYAQWKINTVTLKFNTNGGIIADDSKYYADENGNIYITSSKKIAAPVWEYGYKDKNGLYNASTLKLSRSGYTFLGWSLSKTDETIYDQDDSSVSANDLFPDIKTKSGEVLLYARWEKNEVIGDCNADGELTVADTVLLQKWLLSVPDTKLSDWKAADLCEDGVIDVFDLAMMKRALLSK